MIRLLYPDIKLTIAEALDLGRFATPWLTIYRHPVLINTPKPSPTEIAWLSTPKAVIGLGKPRVIVRTLESSPGLWTLVDDIRLGRKKTHTIHYLLWSDGWKKNPCKGTSVEILNYGSGWPDKSMKLLPASLKRVARFCKKMALSVH